MGKLLELLQRDASAETVNTLHTIAVAAHCRTVFIYVMLAKSIVSPPWSLSYVIWCLYLALAPPIEIPRQGVGA